MEENGRKLGGFREDEGTHFQNQGVILVLAIIERMN